MSIGGAVLAFLALQKIGLTNIASALITSSPTLVLLGLAIMCAAMVLRAVSWHAILKAALPRSRVQLSDAVQGTFIGVLMSSTLPARLGEPSRALVVARRTGNPRENLPVVLGTVVSQTLLNIVALIVLGAIMFSSVDFFNGHQNALLIAAIAPLTLLIVVLLTPLLLRDTGNRSRSSRVHALAAQVRGAMTRVRAGLIVFRRPRLGTTAAVAQLSAWALQCLSCYVLLVALGLDKHGAGIGAAAAVLFAVNITAVLPATPANLGVFQAACAAVLHTGWHVGYGDGVAYGVILQAVEVDERDPDGHAGAAQGGHVLARGPAARDAHDAGQAAGAPEPAAPVVPAGVTGRRRRPELKLGLGHRRRALALAGDLVDRLDVGQLGRGASGPCRCRRSARRRPACRSSAGSPTSSRSRRPAGGGRRSRASTARARPRSRPTAAARSTARRAAGRPSRARTARGRPGSPRSSGGPGPARSRARRGRGACSHSAMPSAVWTPSPCTNSCSANSPSASSGAISSVTSSPAVTAWIATTSTLRRTRSGR